MSRKLKILRLKLVNFKPLYLSNITSFEYTIDQVIQLILGSNGSGKSSLLRMLTPDAPDSKEFDTNGEKVIEIETEKGIYLLTSKFGTGKKHSFVFNGQELNDGYTVTVFKELVKREFGYDASLHKLLTGSIGFCQMAPNVRKELLYKLCDLNLDYVLDVFQKALSNHRDLKGALKHITSKLDPLTLKLMPEDEVLSLREEMKDLETTIVKLTSYSNPSLEDPEKLKQTLNGLFREIDTVLTGVENTHAEFNTGEIKEEKERLAESIPVLVERNNAIGKEINVVNDKLRELNKICDVLDDNENVGSLESIENDIQKLKDKHQWILDYDWSPLGNLEVALKDLHEAYSELQTNLLPDIKSVRVFSLDERNTIYKQRSNLTASISKLTFNIEKQEEILHHSELAKAGDVECSNCGFTNLALKSLSREQTAIRKAELAKARLSLDEMERSLESVEENYQELLRYDEAVRQVKHVIEDRKAVAFVLRQQPLNDFLLNSGPVMIDLFTVLTAVKEQQKSLDSLKRLKRLEEVRDLMVLSDIGYDKSKVKYYECRFEELLGESKAIKEALASQKVRLGRVSAFITKADKLAVLLDKMTTVFKSFSKNSAFKIVNSKLAEASITLAMVRNKLAQHNGVRQSIEALHVDREDLTHKRKRYEELLTALSPNKGLIADIVSSVLVKFTDDVNKTVSRIWDYPLTLKPYENQSNLNYKFPLATDSNEVFDVSLGSKGQQDVINLAVTLNAMRYLSLTDYPLFLDEVGSSFDFTHRQNYIRMIRDLATTGDCSQIFCVNHFTSDYGGITNADVVVLSPDNIIVPDTHNLTVTMS